ncbi:MAG TPA: elongation factor G [Actinomycetota bacterium]|nr:elongation factor G [Actinomycetota bacterium]
MKSYPTDKIRNVILVGHQGAGKTSLAEALLFASGTINRPGRVEDGNTVTDFDPDEVKRQISVSLGLAPFEWHDHKINLLDAPGYADFVGDLEAGMRAADAAIIVVSAVDGVEVQAQAAWDIAERIGLPRAIFINKLDRERASFDRTLDELTELFGTKIAPVHLPVGEEHDFHGVVDLLDEKAFFYDEGTRHEEPIPDELADREHKLHEALVESVVVADDSLMERYLEGDPIQRKEVAATLSKAIEECSSVPVLCGSATKGIGVDLLAEFFVEELPSPADRPPRKATIKGGETIELAPTTESPLSAVVFKTLADPFVGKITFFRVFSGSLRPDAPLYNATRDLEERIGQVFTMRGKTQENMSEIGCGDIGAIAKLNDTLTGDTISNKAQPLTLKAWDIPDPLYSVAIAPKAQGDEDKMSSALHKLEVEDPTFRWRRDPETHQTVIQGMGETHVDVMIERLHRHHVEVETLPLKIPYRETIRGSASATGQLKKQSGGRGQYAVASLDVSPLPRGSGFEFEDAIVGGAIPNNFIPSVEKGCRKTLEDGVLAGYPVIDVKARLFDGKFHSVDSSDIAFQIAGGQAFKDACLAAGVVLLEPVVDLIVTIPDDFTGDIMGDLSSRRARIEGTESVGKGWNQIKAKVPQAEVVRYAIDLRSMTGGRGAFSVAPSHYDPCPPNVQEKVVAEAAKMKEEASK